MNGTSRQLLEAADPNVNAVVSASAGTGKTWLLVARLQRLLLAGARPASILAITFTEKAAAEIRERLTGALREWTRIGDAQLAEELARIGAPRTQAARARELYEELTYAENDLRVLTFHAFCAEILKRFPLEAGVTPGFEILVETWELQDEALNRLYLEAAAEGAGSGTARALETLFLTCNGLSNTNKALRNFLEHRNDWLAYTQTDTRAASPEPKQEPAQNPAHDAALRLSVMLGVALEDADREVTLDDKTRERLETHARLIAKHPTKANIASAGLIRHFFEPGTDIARLVAKHPTEKSVTSAGVIRRFLESDGEIDDDAFDALFKCFFKRDGDIREHEFSSEAFAEALGDAVDEFQDNLAALAETFDALKRTRIKRRTLRCNRAWYVAGSRLIKIYEDLKRANRRLDFDDLEWIACRVVNKEADAQWIQYRLNEQIRHVLVDEFQDTNPQQWQLLKPLLEEIASQEGGGSAFIVGDAKQSIYGFRRASPELQDEAERWLKKRMNGRTYTTDCSRRSSPGVIKFINRVFGDGGEKTLTPPGFRLHETERDAPGDVTIIPFAEKGDAEVAPEWRRILQDPPLHGDDHPAFEEGRRIAEHVKRMIEGRVAVHDRDEGIRPMRYGDVTLLLRKRTQLKHYERALIEAGVPHGGGRAEKTFSSLEASDVLALLEFLVNYERNLNLAQVLRSPIFAVGDEQLVALSQAAGDCWFTRLGRLQEDRSLQRAHHLLGNWIEAARTRLPAHDLLDRVYREGDVIRRFRTAAPEGEAELVEKNLLDLLDYSLEFESGRYPDLAAFARHLKRRVARTRTPQAPASPGAVELDKLDQVRILTVHQAKGLEAPLIIVADAGEQRQPNDSYNLLADWPAQAARPEHFLLVPRSDCMDEFTRECKQRLDERETKEEANVLYVALTRARQYLVISGNGKNPQGGWYGPLELHAPKAPPQRETAAGGAEDAAAETDYAPAPRKPLPQAIGFELSPNALIDQTKKSVSGRGGGGDGGQLRGQAVHYALKLLSESMEESELRNVLAARFPQASERLDEWIEYARTLIADKTLSGLFDDARYEQVLNEAPVAFMHGGEQYFGIIDRLCVGADEVWVVDYKTHSASKRREEELKAHYAEQMHAYYLGVKKLWPGRTVRTSLLLTETRRLCDYRFDD